MAGDPGRPTGSPPAPRNRERDRSRSARPRRPGATTPAAPRSRRRTGCRDDVATSHDSDRRSGAPTARLCFHVCAAIAARLRAHVAATRSCCCGPEPLVVEQRREERETRGHRRHALGAEAVGVQTVAREPLLNHRDPFSGKEKPDPCLPVGSVGERLVEPAEGEEPLTVQQCVAEHRVAVEQRVEPDVATRPRVALDVPAVQVAGVGEHRRVGRHAQHVGVDGHDVEQRGEPAGEELVVGVEQADPGRARRTDRLVLRGRGPARCAAPDHAHRRSERLGHLDRLVRGAVVAHDHLGRCGDLRERALQRGGEEVSGVARGHHHRDVARRLAVDAGHGVAPTCVDARTLGS